MVVESGVDAGYVMDEMRVSEALMYLASLEHRNKDAWEQSRMIAYLIAQTNSTKPIQPTDIMRFSWDAEVDKTEAPTNDDIKRLDEKAKRLEEKFNGGLNNTDKTRG